MTGRELIIYILSNGLEDKPLFDNGIFLGYMTDVEAAKKFNVGAATIRVWITQGLIDGVRINDTICVPANTKDPRSKAEDIIPCVVI